MTEDPIFVTEKTSMDKVALIFEKRQIHHVPVLNEAGLCTGVISMNDFLQINDKFTRFNLKSSEKINRKIFPSLLAKEVMSKDPICIDADEPIENAIEAFLSNVFRALVVKSEGRMVGIVTPYDIIQQLSKHKKELAL